MRRKIKINNTEHTFSLGFIATKLISKSIKEWWEKPMLEFYEYCAWCGLKAGAEVEDKEFNIEFKDFARWINQDIAAQKKLIEYVEKDVPACLDMITKVHAALAGLKK